ncbi:MAG: DNA mismatch repair endonuclease MutL, partial [Thermoplasmata archaeon]|nr:DNA mismatch repair endonuclease MutL [Thermoplasmata archaeon]
ALADLQTVATHGFRGEALPSIASVSHLTLRTRDESGPAGTEVEVRHGRPVHVKDVGHPRGTTVEVLDLFGGVPARRKFLRADATEAAHVAEAVTLLALAHPDVGFVLTSGGRRVLEAPAVDGLASRLFQLFGSAALATLVPVDGGETWARVSGLVSRPDADAGARGSLRLFVNRRPVRDRAIARALSEAYRAAGVRDPRAQAFLFLDVPPHMVDVNVHPAKTEVRFADGRVVWSAVGGSVRAALSAGSRSAPRADVARVQEAVGRYVATHSDPGPRTPHGTAAVPTDPGPRQDPLLAAGLPTVLGQHRNTYIVATDGEDILLVDQHTAHERVHFERIVAGRAGRSVDSQMLLAPLVVTLPPKVRPLVEERGEALKALGFDVEAFGGGSTRLRAIPALLGARDPVAALEAILRDLLERDAAEWVVPAGEDRLAATLACHSAVRAGQPLAPATMLAIVRDLAATAHPSLCPHGRPTSVRIPRTEVARWFGRTGWRRQ